MLEDGSHCVLAALWSHFSYISGLLHTELVDQVLSLCMEEGLSLCGVVRRTEMFTGAGSEVPS